MELKDKNVLLGVTSGVAIYKACPLIGKLRYLGANAQVVMTKNATELITPRYFAELTKNPVAVEMFESIDQHEVKHIALAEWADMMVIAPATANIIGKVAGGIADDMLSTTILAVPVKKTPVIFVPAMNTAMWENPVLQENIAKLQAYKYGIIPPVSGRLACGTEGAGKMASPDDIIEFLKNIL